jgi:hypothetical protein
LLAATAIPARHDQSLLAATAIPAAVDLNEALLETSVEDLQPADPHSVGGCATGDMGMPSGAGHVETAEARQISTCCEAAPSNVAGRPAYQLSVCSMLQH